METKQHKYYTNDIKVVHKQTPHLQQIIIQMSLFFWELYLDYVIQNRHQHNSTKINPPGWWMMDESVICVQLLVLFYLCDVKTANLFHLLMETFTWCLLLVGFAEKLPAGVLFSLRLNWCQYFDQLCLHKKAFQYDARANYGGGAFKSSHRWFGVAEHRGDTSHDGRRDRGLHSQDNEHSGTLQTRSTRIM